MGFPDNNNITPGTVERRIIAHFLEGIKRNIYDLATLKFRSRDSYECEIFKDEVRRIFIKARVVCYDMIKDDLDATDRKLTGDELISIVRYVIPDGVTTGPLLTPLAELVNFTFNREAATFFSFLGNKVGEYVAEKLPRFKTHYDEEWAWAVKHINQSRSRLVTEDKSVQTLG